MRYLNLLCMCISLPVLFIGCAKWKETGKTVKTSERAYTGIFFDKDNGVAVGYSGLVMNTNDGGRIWISGANRSMCLFAAETVDGQTCYAAGNGHNVIRSKNAGKQWGRVEDFTGAGVRGKSISFADSELGWVASKLWLGETSDAGKTWKEIPFPEDVKIMETVCCTGAGTGYIIAKNGGLYATSDAGASWQSLGKPFPEDDAKFRPIYMKDTQGVAMRFNGLEGTITCVGVSEEKAQVRIKTTKDGGKTWSKAEKHDLDSAPMSVSLSKTGTIAVFNADTTMTVFAN